ncbi:hypothetical protein L6452_22164 [Arctium lappa]|uniref:Uncharacterized protein n=1 Tax=Arctium lappa TaxID=4217 RepID=A0ACB9AY60_ARCLA|nr:hypothetical protein L6452_22164 [Arctium lappa]
MLTGEALSINKILSRELSVGQSSRVYYRSTTNIGVPFEWEKKPGTPLDPPQEEVITQQTPPPPSPLPPPAMQSIVLQRPSIYMKDSSWSWRFSSIRRKLSNNMRLKMYNQRWYSMRFSSNGKGNNVIILDGDSDVELVPWIHRDSKSSSSSMLSSSIGLSNEKFESFRKGIPFCCTKWRRYKR